MQAASVEAGHPKRSPRSFARADVRTILPAVVAGIVGGLLALSASISYPAVIFTGAFEAHLGVGIGMALFGSAVVGAIVALGSTYPPAIANSQIETAVVLGTVATAVASAHAAAGEIALATLLGVIFVATIMLGLVFVLFGVFRLGNTIRYIPFPVIGAFLAYIAYLLLRGGISIMIGQPLTLQNLPVLFAPGTLAYWLPGFFAAVALLALQLTRRHYLNAPAVLVCSVAAFWLVAWLAGASAEAVRDAGFLLAGLSEEQTWSPVTSLAALPQADWALALSQLPQIAIVCLVAMVTLLVTASSLEVASRSDVDLNKELKITGIANLFSGVGGGLPGYHSVSASLLPHYLGTRSRLVGLISAGMCATVLLVGGPLLAYVPRLLLGLVLIYLALDIATELIRDRWPKLPAADRGILLLVLFSLIWLGFVQGIGLGIVAGLAVFAVNYARLDTIRASGTAASFASNVLRPPEQLRFLAEQSDALQVIQLQGYLFFGSAHRVLEGISTRLGPSGANPLRFLVLDFEWVDGADSSTIFSFIRLVERADQQGVRVLFSEVPPSVAAALHAAGLDQVGSGPRVFPDLDHALEYAEDALLAAAQHASVADQGKPAVPDAAIREVIAAYGTRVEWRAGDYAMRQGEQAEDMYFVESGRLTAQLDLADGSHVRLRTIMPGTVIGEVGCYLGLRRSASVVADEDSSAYRLSKEALARLRAENPSLAVAFHEFIACTAAERLAYNTGLLQSRLL